VTETIREVFYLTEWDPGAPVQKVLYVSPAYETIWQRSCQSLYDDPRSWSSDIHPEDRAAMVEAYLAGATLGTYDVEYRLLRPDGSVRWIHDRAFSSSRRSASAAASRSTCTTG
jgi:PAS domain-containing protein